MMKSSYGPFDREYTIIPPATVEELETIEAATMAIVRLFEAGSIALKESAARAVIVAETQARVESFRASMALIETQLANQNLIEARRQASWFSIAEKLIERGKEELAMIVLDKVAKEGRPSLVQPLIDYHRMITLGMLT